MVDLPKPRIARIGPNRYELAIPDEEREVLANLMDQLRDLLMMDDPAARRVFPTAYANDPDRDEEYRVLTHDDLLAGRLAAIETIEETLSETELDAPGLEAWTNALNTLRLVLGTKLDVGEELPDLDLDDPEAPAYAVYEYLGWLLEHAVRALMADLPD